MPSHEPSHKPTHAKPNQVDHLWLLPSSLRPSTVTTTTTTTSPCIALSPLLPSRIWSLSLAALRYFSGLDRPFEPRGVGFSISSLPVPSRPDPDPLDRRHLRPTPDNPHPRLGATMGLIYPRRAWYVHLLLDRPLAEMRWLVHQILLSPYEFRPRLNIN